MTGGLPVDAPDLREKPTLRFLTCGSVDDGKSTLIGRQVEHPARGRAPRVGGRRPGTARPSTSRMASSSTRARGC